MEFEPCVVLMKVNNATNVTHFNQILTTLFDGLITKAASGDSLLKFALGNATFSNSETIYALAQCTPDLSQVDCNDCLSNATDLLSQCCSGRLGARVFTPSCNIRYGKQIFYDPLVAMPLPPSPVADAPILPPVDAPSPSPPVVSAPPPQKPCIEIGEGMRVFGFYPLFYSVRILLFVLESNGFFKKRKAASDLYVHYKLIPRITPTGRTSTTSSPLSSNTQTNSGF
ncbi:hypothetical protein CRYUN_Cryun32bG0043100 [Craigia yunnanensis]